MLTKEDISLYAGETFELVVFFFGFSSSALLACCEVSLSLIMGISVWGVARSSELNYADFKRVQRRAATWCRVVLCCCVSVSLATGAATVILLSDPPANIFAYRIGFAYVFGSAPIFALGIYLWFYLKMLPWTRSIEAATEGGSGGSRATVSRFGILLFRRIALYLAPFLLCMNSGLMLPVTNSSINVDYSFMLASCLGTFTALVYLSTERFSVVLKEKTRILNPSQLSASGRGRPREFSASDSSHRVQSWARLPSEESDGGGYAALPGCDEDGKVQRTTSTASQIVVALKQTLTLDDASEVDELGCLIDEIRCTVGRSTFPSEREAQNSGISLRDDGLSSAT